MGYVGESVVLPSDADPSWTLSSIRWSIYENFTNIAVLQSKTVIVDRVPLFRGRLELNTSSGHLTIKNVSSRDALKYRVELVDRILAQFSFLFRNDLVNQAYVYGTVFWIQGIV
ncbi:hypothetical protein AMELA_G00059970 [Ameiurus melas]|uniref:Uncharacterized protein n=1 Tax=Ameiurus melas TaxID=219545 RepID=A0A7J6B1P2_AMEME|nr:hypothetical protein AMELA_G00059970 [Ameiurus melas]